ncbi:hypothetical protein DFH29DRAFT_1001150 [Suillus ampliporus]|nr:hypothetical protein DFH29DRAFT_1001150 [Suillus ampliporus]
MIRVRWKQLLTSVLDASPNVVSSTDTFAISSASHSVMATSCKQAEHGEINVSTFSNTEAAAASASGLSPTNAITVTNDVNVNGKALAAGDWPIYTITFTPTHPGPSFMLEAPDFERNASTDLHMISSLPQMSKSLMSDIDAKYVN